MHGVAIVLESFLTDWFLRRVYGPISQTLPAILRGNFDSGLVCIHTRQSFIKRILINDWIDYILL